MTGKKNYSPENQEGSNDEEDDSKIPWFIQGNINKIKTFIKTIPAFRPKRGKYLVIMALIWTTIFSFILIDSRWGKTAYAPQLGDVPVAALNLSVPAIVLDAYNPGALFEATGYDLSVQCCGKPIGHPAYGLTASGYNLAGKTWEEALTIAADPRVIPLGTKVRLIFLDRRHQKYNGYYTVRDTGNAVKGRVVDVFVGDFLCDRASDEAVGFGRTRVRVQPIY
ncbi:MAG: 3D domain-containing protein [Syntrophomonadaceae bacterium]|jgi:3D (Asp-Asp-Asp) domain-containing protein